MEIIMTIAISAIRLIISLIRSIFYWLIDKKETSPFCVYEI